MLNRFWILHRARQYHCRALCKFSMFWTNAILLDLSLTHLPLVPHTCVSELVELRRPAGSVGGQLEWRFVNSLSPGRRGCDLKCVYFKQNMRTDIMSIYVNITLEWMPRDPVDKKSTLFGLIQKLKHLVAWWRKASSQCPNQCWRHKTSLCHNEWNHHCFK